jgi:hypothetical protein
VSHYSGNNQATKNPKEFKVNPNVPTITVEDRGNGRYVLRATRTADGEVTMTRDLAMDHTEINTEYSAEQVAAYARGLLADAFSAGQAESVGDVAHDHALIGQLRAAEAARTEERDALSETVDQLNALVTEKQELVEQAHRRILEMESWTTDDRITELQATVNDREQQIVAFEGRVRSFDARIEELSQLCGRWSRSFDMVGQYMMEKAEEKGYCSDYDEVVDELQHLLPIGELPVRRKEYTASITVEVQYTVTYRDDENDLANSIRAAIESAASRNPGQLAFEVTDSSYDNVYAA